MDEQASIPDLQELDSRSGSAIFALPSRQRAPKALISKLLQCKEAATLNLHLFLLSFIEYLQDSGLASEELPRW